MRRNLLRLLKITSSLSLFLLVNTYASGQAAPAITQDTKNSACSNIVALAGNVEVNCSSLTPAQRKMIEGIPNILKKILANQLDPNAVMDKLDEILKGVNEVREQQGPWRITPEQQSDLRELLKGHHAALDLRTTRAGSETFTADLYGALKGYNTATTITTDGTLNPNIQGIVVSVSHDFPEAQFFLKSLQAVFGEMVREVTLSNPQYVTGDNMLVIIGNRPQPKTNHPSEHN